jgi:FkbM family methyltransferase
MVGWDRAYMKKFMLRIAAFAAQILPDKWKTTIYRSPYIARVIRNGLNMAAPEGKIPTQVASGNLKGMHLELDLQTEKDYWLGTYESVLQSAIHDLVKPGSIAYDVGANIGYISLLLARAVGEKGKVFAFEALPENQIRLYKNIAHNKMNMRISVVRAAVIDTCRPVRFMIGPSNGMGKAEGSAGRQEFEYPQSIMVTGTSLDTFVYVAGRPAPQVVKMDIEGGEVLALPGMRRILHEARPIMLLELHGEESARVAWDILTAENYRFYIMAPGYPPISQVEELEWKSYLIALPIERPG